MKDRKKLIKHLNACLKNKDFASFESGLRELDRSKQRDLNAFERACNYLRKFCLKLKGLAAKIDN
jgi:hypothetical protein